jgi:STE24 endopeptidase
MVPSRWSFMNLYAFIILAALLSEYLLNLIASGLYLKTLTARLPAEFEDVFDQAAYKKMQAYTRTSTRFGVVTDTFDLFLLLIFWFAGGFNQLDLWIRSWNWPVIASGLAFIGLLSLAFSLLSLPFSVYDTFRIEARFGFNRTTIKTFVLDRLKGLLLGIVLGGPLLAGVLAFFQYAGPYAWLYGWLVSAIFTLVMTLVAPVWIMPLFNKFTPLEEGELKRSNMSYANRIGFRVSDIFVMDGSKRSNKSNAFFTGFGRNKRIALYDTLIEKHSVAELTAILAHEIGHYKRKHILISTAMSLLHLGVMFFLLALFISRPALHAAFYMQKVSLYAGLLFFGLLYSPVELLLSPALNALSRRHEFAADRFAASTTGLAAALIQSLKKLSRDNLSHLTPHPFYVFLHYSHPPVLQRIHRLVEMEPAPPSRVAPN